MNLSLIIRGQLEVVVISEGNLCKLIEIVDLGREATALVVKRKNPLVSRILSIREYYCHHYVEFMMVEGQLSSYSFLKGLSNLIWLNVVWRKNPHKINIVNLRMRIPGLFEFKKKGELQLWISVEEA